MWPSLSIHVLFLEWNFSNKAFWILFSQIRCLCWVVERLSEWGVWQLEKASNRCSISIVHTDSLALLMCGHMTFLVRLCDFSVSGTTAFIVTRIQRSCYGRRVAVAEETGNRGSAESDPAHIGLSSRVSCDRPVSQAVHNEKGFLVTGSRMSAFREIRILSRLLRRLRQFASFGISTP
jgi:hypothetical protein